MFKTVLLLAAMFITGCATQLTAPQQEMLSKAKIPLTCTDKQQCDFYWQRAQVWVIQNSRYKIQTANDVLIQTYGSTDYYPGYTVTKDALMDGSARIKIDIYCLDMFGCKPRPWEAAIAFKDFIRNSQ